MDFLERVAQKIYTDHHAEMENQVIVLPSRRAGLYLTRYLSRLSEKPLWSPGMVTVSDLFTSFSELRPASDEKMTFTLFRVYNSMVKEPMSFDDFWSWAEVIISDFGDIDLYLADAEKLYSNITDLREIDGKFGGLDEEIVQIIRKFWVSFNPVSRESRARNRFRSVWEIMWPLYKGFRTELMNEGYAGEGMLCREVAEKAGAGLLNVPEKKMYHIAGLNALNECEKSLFRFLKMNGRALFYWDDDHNFMNDTAHKAAVFITENKKHFPNNLTDKTQQTYTAAKNRWTILDAPSDTAQAKLLPGIFEETGIDGASDLTDTAVVLADEKLLMPVLTSLPDGVPDVNVTMGHPFRFTPLYSFLRQLFIISRSARHEGARTTLRSEEVLVMLRHQYSGMVFKEEGERLAAEIVSRNMIRTDTEFLAGKLPYPELFMVPESGEKYPSFLFAVLLKIENLLQDLRADGHQPVTDIEYVRLAMSETGKLINLMEETGLRLRTDTCIRLIDRILRKLMVPFSGEPLKGLQVMGVLETRAIEFRNIIFLSMNEGVFPRQGYEDTFIPYNIRRAFGLPTVNEHESIYSYHFFRLLRKPARGWFIYNSTSQGLNTGEMSRYLTRMRYDAAYKPEIRSVHLSVGRGSVIPRMHIKTGDHISALMEKYASGTADDSYLSPSAVNTWMNCRMKFYYSYVCGLPEEEKLEREIDQRRFGNILHDVMQRLYTPLVGKPDAGYEIAQLASDKSHIRRTVIDTATGEMKWSEGTLMEGKGIVIVDVIERYVKDILMHDSRNEKLSLLHLEDKFSGIFRVHSGNEILGIRVGGRVDRVDSSGKMIRVVDYKTGSPKKETEAIADLFDETRDRRNDAVMQTMLYCSVLSSEYPGRQVIPAIYWVQKITSQGFDPSSCFKHCDPGSVQQDEWNEMMKTFRESLETLLGKIFSPGEEFVMTDFVQRCNSCPYRRLCRR